MSHAPVRGVSQRAGFTLLELLAVLLVLAILSGIVMVAGQRAVESGRIARARTELAALSVALEAYRRAHGDYPRTDNPSVLLASLLGRRNAVGREEPAGAVLDPTYFRIAPAGPASSGVLLDPWERPYRYAYRTPSDGWANSGFVLYSVGPDGRAGPLLPAGFADAAAPENADNVQAGP